MIVKIQILADDGTTVLAEELGNAACAFGTAFSPNRPLFHGGQKLQGFCYIPEPPPLPAEDSAELRRLAAKHFG